MIKRCKQLTFWEVSIAKKLNFYKTESNIRKKMGDVRDVKILITESTFFCGYAKKGFEF